MLKDDRDARTGRTDGLPVDQDLPGARCEQPTDAAELIAFYVQFNVAKGDDCSFEEKLAGVINDDLGAVSHRKGVQCKSGMRLASLTRRTLPRHPQGVKLRERH